MLVDIDATLEKLKQTLITLSANAQARGVADRTDSDLISDALASIHELQARIQEDPPTELTDLTTSEYKAFDALRRDLDVKAHHGLQGVMATAKVRLRRYKSMASVLFPSDEFKDEPIESIERIKGQFEAWIAWDEQTHGCRGMGTLEYDQMRDAWMAAANKYRSLPRILTDNEIRLMSVEHGILSHYSNVPDKVEHSVMVKFSHDIVKLAAS